METRDEVEGFSPSSCTSNTCILAYNLFWCLQPQQTIYFKIFSGSAHFRRDPFIILTDGWVILGKKETIIGKHSKGAFEISVFWIFIFTVRLGNPKKDLKNCP